jgi:16S rRNA (cytidine1402-2'-O)-methyltransferase
MSEKIEAALYLVATPIGNLGDISYRAVQILTGVDYIACEDTRRTGQLLKSLDIPEKQLISYYEHNEKARSSELTERILQGASIALVTDAGMPCISDPGYVFVNACREAGIKVIPVPGATAFAAALAASGFPSDRFAFLGFPPHKKGRKTFIEGMKDIPMTIILYESPYRLLKLLGEICEYLGDNTKICIARELTKMHEEIITGTAAELKADFEARTAIKGEFVVILG